MFFANLRKTVPVLLGAIIIASLFPLAAATTTYRVVATIPVNCASGVAVNEKTSMVYVTDVCDNLVAVINGRTNQLVTSIPVGQFPDSLAVNPVTNIVYVENSQSNYVTVINGANNQVITNIAVGGTPGEVAVNSATNTVYATVIVGGCSGPGCPPGLLSVIDGRTNTVSTQLSLSPCLSDPIPMAVNPATNRIYVAAYDNPNVTVVDGSKLTIVSCVAVGNPSDGHPKHGLAVNPVTNRVYASRFPFCNPPYVPCTYIVDVLDGSSNTVIASIPLGSGFPFGIGVDFLTNTMFVGLSGGAVAVVDGSTNTVIQNIPVQGNPYGVADNPRTNLAYVGDQSPSNTVSVIGQL